MTRSEQGLSARHATNERTEETQNGDDSMPSESPTTNNGIQTSEDGGFVPTGYEWARSSRTFRPSDAPSSASTKRWRKPRNVREFAAQANEVATMMLNGDLDIDTARAYSSIARGIAQMMSINVTRARFLKTEPVLDFEEDDDGSPHGANDAG